MIITIENKTDKPLSSICLFDATGVKKNTKFKLMSGKIHAFKYKNGIPLYLRYNPKTDRISHTKYIRKAFLIDEEDFLLERIVKRYKQGTYIFQTSDYSDVLLNAPSLITNILEGTLTLTLNKKIK
jgi:hypothetical protein